MKQVNLCNFLLIHRDLLVITNANKKTLARSDGGDAENQRDVAQWKIK